MLWDAQPKLKDVAEERGVHFICRPFDDSVVDCLKNLRIGAQRELYVRSIRDGYVLRAWNVEQIAGHHEASGIGRGTPLDCGLVAG
jgi:hypothetical protein